MKIGSLQVDSARASAGAWVTDIPGMQDLALKVRGFSYEPYVLAVTLATAKLGPESRREGRADGIPLQSAQDKITGRAMAEHIVLDWANLQDDEGKPMDYDIEKALVYLTHPDFRPFNAAATYAAQEVEKRDSRRVSTTLGNSSPASVTS